MAQKSGQRGHQAPKRHVMDVASERGITAIRRPVATESLHIFQEVAELLRQELLGSARLFDPESLGITIVGFSRYDDRHRIKGPPTRDVVRVVASTAGRVAVHLGGLEVFGSDSKHKLGFHLVDDSGELTDEAASLGHEFAAQGFPLRRDHNAGAGFNPHCSIALLYEDSREHIQDRTVLSRLSRLVISHVGDPVIVLDPVE